MLLKRLLLHPQRTLDLECQDGGDDFKILLCMRDPVLFRSMVAPLWALLKNTIEN